MLLFNHGIDGQDNLCLTGSEGGPVKTCASAQIIFDPRWSPAGNKISFIQSVKGSSQYWLSILDLSNMKVKRILPTDVYAWSPDSQKLYVASEEDGGRIIDLHTGKHTDIGRNLRQGIWLDNNTILAYYGPKPEIKPTLRILSLNGKVQRELPVNIDDPDITGEGSFPDALYRVPDEPDTIIYGAHAGNSTNGRWEIFYMVNLKTGLFHKITDGQYLAWGPDGKQFITGAPRELVKRTPDKLVWTSPLTIVSKGEYTKKPIVSGQVWVDGLDWRN